MKLVMNINISLFAAVYIHVVLDRRILCNTCIYQRMVIHKCIGVSKHCGKEADHCKRQACMHV